MEESDNGCSTAWVERMWQYSDFADSLKYDCLSTRVAKVLDFRNTSHRMFI